MDIQQALKEEAEFAARTLQGPASMLRRELRELEKRKAEIEARLAAAERSHGRLASFQPLVGRDYQCPRCWVRDGARSVLSPIPGTATHDIMRCRGGDFNIPLR
jgi:hypothetical protein